MSRFLPTIVLGSLLAPFALPAQAADLDYPYGPPRSYSERPVVIQERPVIVDRPVVVARPVVVERPLLVPPYPVYRPYPFYRPYPRFVRRFAPFYGPARRFAGRPFGYPGY